MRRWGGRLAGAAALGWLLVLLLVAAWGTRDASGHGDVIVVLGAAHYAGRPSPVLRARLDQGVALWRAGRAPRLLVTGGRRAGDALSEAEAGARYLRRHGVPTSAILLEVEGRTTLASMRGAARVLHEAVGAQPRVLLVSDPFHMLRLELVARLLGMRPLPTPTRTSPISARTRVQLEYLVRETGALPADVWQLVRPGGRD
ncbi:MAG: YdcF family protein [Gemmatimonadetes bacterium]|nr:YdcF family protein [Gemmatimonadota bacterium]